MSPSVPANHSATTSAMASERVDRIDRFGVGLRAMCTESRALKNDQALTRDAKVFWNFSTLGPTTKAQ